LVASSGGGGGGGGGGVFKSGHYQSYHEGAILGKGTSTATL